MSADAGREGDYASEGFNITSSPSPTESYFPNVTIDPFWDYAFGNETETEWTTHTKDIYVILCFSSIYFCIVAILTNAYVLFTLHWMKQPRTPTICFSISLTTADAFSALLIMLGLIINSLLPRVYSIRFEGNCINLTLEVFRLSGILISTFHLLAVAFNHYFGIMYPLRSRATLTPTVLKTIISLIWILPSVYIFTYFASFKNQAFQNPQCLIDQETNFLTYSRFRNIFSSMFFIPMILMFIMYTHITIKVRRNQMNRTWYNRQTRRHESMGIAIPHRNSKRPEKNLKVVKTSVLILSTYVICFMPVVLVFSLICKDCYFKFEDVGLINILAMSSISNVLLILKYFINPLIYAAKLKEIKAAREQLNAIARRKLFGCGKADDLDLRFRNRVERSGRYSFFKRSSKRQDIELTTIRIETNENRPSTSTHV